MVQNTKEILIWVGLVAAVSAGAAGLLGSGVISSAQTESLEIAEASFKKTGTANGVLTIAVKNAGTSQINDVMIVLNGINLDDTSVTTTAFGDTVTRTTGTTPNIAPYSSKDCSGATDCVNIAFDNTIDEINAGQTVYRSATVPDTDDKSIGESFTITVSGEIGDGTNATPIVTSGVVTITGF